MNKTVRDSIAFTNKFISLTGRVFDRDIVLCPPFTAIYPVSREIEGSIIKLGAQNLFYEDKGAYTGEVAGEMLREAGCKYVIIGHSERRKYFQETDKIVNLKVKKADYYGLIPVICIGENENEKSAGKTREVVGNQLKKAFEDFTSSQVEKFIIAYEPIWAIGTGKVETPEQANGTIEFLRNILSSIFGYSVASRIRFLYGGSATADNASSFMERKEIDGLLVGGASLDPEVFYKICRS
jgi:triosephosphate isomerase